MLFPSGDHPAWSPSQTRSIFPVAIVIRQMPELPPRVDVNRMLAPSGLNAGSTSASSGPPLGQLLHPRPVRLNRPEPPLP